jgi:hypothetical protein
MLMQTTNEPYTVQYTVACLLGINQCTNAGFAPVAVQISAGCARGDRDIPSPIVITF